MYRKNGTVILMTLLLESLSSKQFLQQSYKAHIFLATQILCCALNMLYVVICVVMYSQPLYQNCSLALGQMLFDA
jgi:hypothetical protein